MQVSAAAAEEDNGFEYYGDQFKSGLNRVRRGGDYGRTREAAQSIKNLLVQIDEW